MGAKRSPHLVATLEIFFNLGGICPSTPYANHWVVNKL